MRAKWREPEVSAAFPRGVVLDVGWQMCRILRGNSKWDKDVQGAIEERALGRQERGTGHGYDPAGQQSGADL